MTPGNVTETETLKLEDIKLLADAGGPCITILQPLLPAPNELRQNQARIKAAIQAAERKLAEKKIEPAHARELLQPLFALAGDAELAGGYNGFAAFRSPQTLRHFLLREAMPECVEVGDHFHVRPLLASLDGERAFYILALSQKHIRLLRCTGRSSEEVPLPDSVPKTFDADRQTDRPDHVQDNKSAGGPSTGSMRGVMFTTSTDRESKDEYLSHFYQHVDKGLHQVLRDEQAPLVLAGVEYELAIYRAVNSYAHLAEGAVHGSPDGLKGGELHKRALEAVAPEFEAGLNKALAQFDEQKGGDRATRTVKEIVRAAFDGRVAFLFVSENGHYMGNFDEATHNVRGHKQPLPGDEDLLNAAALQTIAHGGRVFVLPASKVPDGAAMAAVMRY